MIQSTNTLESTKAAFQQWRMTRRKQGKIPDYLWEQVKDLLDDYSLTNICSALGITHNQIKHNTFSFDKPEMQFSVRLLFWYFIWQTVICEKSKEELKPLLSYPHDFIHPVLHHIIVQAMSEVCYYSPYALKVA